MPKESINILKTNGFEIPERYLQYISSSNFTPYFSIFEDEDDFKLYNLEELSQVRSIDGMKVLVVHQLKAFVSTILEVNEGFFDEEDISLYKEIASSIVIGYENSRILYIGSDERLAIFHLDGGDIEQTDISLSDIIK